MIHNFDTMRELIDKLNYYTKLYVLSNQEWVKNYN